jgi:hypothetical protein
VWRVDVGGGRGGASVDPDSCIHQQGNKKDAQQAHRRSTRVCNSSFSFLIARRPRQRQLVSTGRAIPRQQQEKGHGLPALDGPLLRQPPRWGLQET